MLRFILSALSTFIGTYCLAHSSLIYISAKPTSCLAYSYEIEITQLSDNASDVVFGGIEIVYGDGNREEIPQNDFTLIEINNDRRITKYVKKHVFQGPGTYSINARFFNRGSNIQNMQNSVNTPFYVTTEIHIDPYLGCNHTPSLENLPLTSKSGSTYFYDFSFIDQENDSLSFYLITPLQDLGIPVVDYQIPGEQDIALLRKISKISIDHLNGSVLLNSKNMAGIYTVAINVIEWRKIEGVYFQMSSSTLDYQIDLLETDNNFAEIIGINDTAIITGNIFTNRIEVYDPDGDSIQVNAYGDFSQLVDSNLDESFDYYPGPIERNIHFMPLAEHVRAKPYKSIVTATDKNDSSGSLSNTRSMYIWITDREHEPTAPEKLVGQAISEEQINIYWSNVDDELGYIIERADLHFSKFARLAILPPNSTYFNDSSVVENNTYQYRITAVGTKMSDYRIVEVTTPDIITALHVEKFDDKFKIFPNPSKGSFLIQQSSGINGIEILNLTGKTVWELNDNLLPNAKQDIEISTNLPGGTYILRFNSIKDTLSKKIIIN